VTELLNSEEATESRAALVRKRLSFGNIGAVYVWALIIIVFAIAIPSKFIEGYTLRAVVNSYSITGLAAMAVLMPMASGTFDASIGGNISLSGVICASLLIHTSLSIPVIILVTLASGLALGLLNSFIVVVLGISSLIGTLATWLIADALSVAISDNTTLYSARTEGAFSHYLSNANIDGFAIPIVFLVGIALIMGLGLSRTVGGRYVYAVGFNLRASKISGIRVKSIQTASLLSSGLVGSFAGIILAAHVSSATPGIGDSYLLPAFAAVFVGATQFTKKRFSASGTLLAVFMLGTGEYGLLAAGAPQWTPNVFQGLALVAAIGMTQVYDPRKSCRKSRQTLAPELSTSSTQASPAVTSGNVTDATTSVVAASASDSTEEQTQAVSVTGLSKTFPGQKALVNVSFDVRPGEIHALLGQNGSGKSTLIKVLAGIYSPDEGSVIRVNGEKLAPNSPRDSRKMGLQFVHQTLGIIEELTAVENIALGFGYRRRNSFFINWPEQRKKTLRLLENLSVDLDINCPVSELRPVERSAIAIARALDDDDGPARVLVLDEPTAALPPHEVEALFSLVRRASANGTSVIYVSHRLNEIFELAQRATVLRDGVSQGTFNVGDIDHATLVHLIIGDAKTENEQSTAPAREEESVDGNDHVGDDAQIALKVRHLVAQRIDDISFDVGYGEVVGVAGLTGSGREELAEALVGERVGQVTLENIEGRRRSEPSPRQAKDLGVVLVLPNRSSGAAIADFSIEENISLPSLSRDSTWGIISRNDEKRHTRHWIDVLDIRPRDPDRTYSFLSGGNQQKVIFGKWLVLTPKVMVIEDPTSGVDVGARQAIYELIRVQATQGVSFIVCSSDSDDLLAVCDRILVLDNGKVVQELTGDDIEESRLLMAMVGASRAAVTP